MQKATPHCLLFIFLFWSGLSMWAQQASSVRFERISLEDGLSQNNVLSIFQDSRGFMWFGTEIGLNKYDGYNFIHFKKDPHSLNSISDDYVSSISEDASGILWIGTSGGLNRLDPATGKFTHYRHDPADSNSLSNDIIKVVFQDRSGNLWVGTNKGLNRLDKVTGHFKRYTKDSAEEQSISDNEVKCIYQDRAGRLWIGTEGGGLNRLDPQTGTFDVFRYQADDPSTISSDQVSVLFEDRSGLLWVGTDDDGLNSFHHRTQSFQRFRHEPTDPHSISSDKIRAVYEDHLGTLWVGTWGGGLNQMDRQTGRFIHHQYDARNPFSLSDNEIRAIYEDRSGAIWVGSWSGGLNRFTAEPSPFLHYQHLPEHNNSLSGNHVRSIFEDHLGIIWIGTWGGGLNRFDPVNRVFTHYRHQPDNVNSLSGDEVNCIFEDDQQRLWIGTDDGALDRLDKDRKQFHHFRRKRKDPSTLSDNEVRSIYQDRQKTIWVGTWGGGLNRFDESTGQFERFQYDPADPASISSDRVTSIVEMPDGQLWIGTWGGGLNKLMSGDDSFQHYQYEAGKPQSLNDNFITGMYIDRQGTLWIGTRSGGLNKMITTSPDGKITFEQVRTENGLSSNAIMGIVEDDYGNLWISTVNGLNRYHLNSGQISHYDVHDGLQSNQFDYAVCRSKQNGALMFGGINGFNIFLPDQIKENSYVPPVVITNLRRREKANGTHLILEDRNIFSKREITLPFKSNMLEFEFAALSFRNPFKNQYAYRLEGLNEGWVYLPAQRSVQFTNLAPGSYTLRVKASNNHGIWNEEGATLHITILPPWWRSWWAFALYSLAILAFGYGIYHFQLNKRLAETEAERLRELDSFKSKLYTNITHEFRTPLTVIMGMAEEIKPEKARDLIRRNSQQLLRLVNQMLDLRKLETGTLQKNIVQGDLIGFVKYLMESIQSYAKTKGVRLSFSSIQPKQMMDYDPDKLQQILSNLLINAVKYTPQGGKVHLSIHNSTSPATAGQEWVCIRVEDTGIGIAAADLPHIFDRFYQVDNSSTRRREGTGVGLALTKSLIELLGGKITVQSEVGLGTRFDVLLPVSRQAAISTSLAEWEAVPAAISQEDTPAPEAEVLQTGTKADLPLVLLVEDNADVVQYLISCLQTDYRLQVAPNGRAGLEQAIETVPDLIISDVMMPEMDGFEMTGKLKKDERSSHIPIVLLTAKADVSSRIQGLERGADAYLPKPFNKDELLVRLRKLLELRQKLQRYYLSLAAGGQAEPVAEDTGMEQPVEHDFVRKVRAIIENHLDDCSLNVEKLCRELAMSHSQLHRKLSALTGYSTNRFIRFIRLSKAKILLTSTEESIANIAYDTGFTDPDYFSRIFKKEIGMTPTEYKERQ